MRVYEKTKSTLKGNNYGSAPIIAALLLMAILVSIFVLYIYIRSVPKDDIGGDEFKQPNKIVLYINGVINEVPSNSDNYYKIYDIFSNEWMNKYYETGRIYRNAGEVDPVLLSSILYRIYFIYDIPQKWEISSDFKYYSAIVVFPYCKDGFYVVEDDSMLFTSNEQYSGAVYYTPTGSFLEVADELFLKE